MDGVLLCKAMSTKIVYIKQTLASMPNVAKDSAPFIPNYRAPLYTSKDSYDKLIKDRKV